MDSKSNVSFKPQSGYQVLLLGCLQSWRFSLFPINFFVITSMIPCVIFISKGNEVYDGFFHIYWISFNVNKFYYLRHLFCFSSFCCCIIYNTEVKMNVHIAQDPWQIIFPYPFVASYLRWPETNSFAYFSQLAVTIKFVIIINHDHCVWQQTGWMFTLLLWKTL